VWDEARDLLRVSRIERPDASLLSPDQAFFVRENLKLRLQGARLALLARQYEAARADLAAAATSLGAWFDPGGAAPGRTLPGAFAPRRATPTCRAWTTPGGAGPGCSRLRHVEAAMRAALWLIGLFAAPWRWRCLRVTTTARSPCSGRRTASICRSTWCCAAGAAGAALLRALRTAGRAALELPRQARRWRQQQRERATNALLLDAAVHRRPLPARKAAESVLAAPGRHAAAADAGADWPAHPGQPDRREAHALQDEARAVAGCRRWPRPAPLAPAPSRARRCCAARRAVGRQHPRPLARWRWPSCQRRSAPHRRCASKLKAARQAGHIAEAMETARLLAKHRAFSPPAPPAWCAAGRRAVARATTPRSCSTLWAAAGPAERAMPELALRAAQRLLDLKGSAALARSWLRPCGSRAGPARRLTDASSAPGAGAGAGLWPLAARTPAPTPNGWPASRPPSKPTRTTRYAAAPGRRGLPAPRPGATEACWPNVPARCPTPACAERGRPGPAGRAAR
jgi:HemY protein